MHVALRKKLMQMAQSTVEYPKRDVVDTNREAPIHVLHVDDEAGFLKAAKQILEMQGAFQVDTASSVDEATEKMKEKAYDAIVCDYIMPRKNGLQFLKELRDSGNNIPFIVFTGKGREEVAIEALNLGADRYLSKIGGAETVYGELAHGIRQAVDRKRADMEIWQREERLRALFASSPDAITVIDLNGNIRECNQATLDMLGFSSKDGLIGKNGFALVAKSDREGAKGSLQKLLEQGSIKGREIVAVTKDGREFNAELSASVVKDSSGHPTSFVGIVRNITNRKRAENALKESEAKYKNLFENAKDVTVTLDLKGNITSINKAAVKYGFKRDETLGKNMLKFVPKRYWPRLLKDLTMLARGKPAEGTVEINTPKGKRIAEYSSIPMIIDDKVQGVQSILEDITEHKKTEEALHESRTQFQTFFNAMVDPVVIVDGKGKILEISESLVKIGGFKREELVGKHFLKVKGLTAKSKAILMKNFPKRMMGVEIAPYEVEMLTKDGRKIPAEVNAAKINYMGKTAILAVFRDITERKKARQVLKKSEERYRSIVELAPDSIMTFDRKGVITSCNTASTRLSGYSKDELVGKHFAKIGVLRARDVPRYLRMLPSTLRGKVPKPFEVVYRQKNGTLRLGEVRMSLMREGDKIVGIQAIMRDITERKKTHEKLETINEKLSVVGSLTRHDVRNKLSTVTNNVYLAKQKVTDDHEALEYLRQTESAVREMERIFDFARIYEKLGIEELVYMDVTETLEETVQLFSDLHSIKVVNDCQGLTVLADSLLRQLFYNLIDNSLKHGEKVSQIRVYYEKAKKDTLKLAYEDDGVGISKAEKEKIFNEGYGKGSGYGLFLIRKMCEVYGWTIRETSKQGKGAQFTIAIPKVGGSGKPSYRLR